MCPAEACRRACPDGWWIGSGRYSRQATWLPPGGWSSSSSLVVRPSSFCLSSFPKGPRVPQPPRSRLRRLTSSRLTRRLLPFVALAVGTSGCGLPSFGFPSDHGITEQSKLVYNIWSWSCIAALAVGVFVWGLIGYAVVKFRKRDDVLPAQVRYNLPIEVLYTVVPFIIIGALFFWTAKYEDKLNELHANPPVTIDVEGFKWQWRFTHVDATGADTGVYEVGGNGVEPVLVLPVGERIRFVETSNDVIHSFWIPEFLFKRDVIPGRTNQFEVTVDKTGTFVGRCAELCGVQHDRMNFSVKVVSQADYATYLTMRKAQIDASNAAVTAPVSLTTTGS